MAHGRQHLSGASAVSARHELQSSPHVGLRIGRKKDRQKDDQDQPAHCGQGRGKNRKEIGDDAAKLLSENRAEWAGGGSRWVSTLDRIRQNVSPEQFVIDPVDRLGKSLLEL